MLSKNFEVALKECKKRNLNCLIRILLRNSHKNNVGINSLKVIIICTKKKKKKT